MCLAGAGSRSPSVRSARAGGAPSGGRGWSRGLSQTATRPRRSPTGCLRDWRGIAGLKARHASSHVPHRFNEARPGPPRSPRRRNGACRSSSPSLVPGPATRLGESHRPGGAGDLLKTTGCFVFAWTRARRATCADCPFPGHANATAGSRRSSRSSSQGARLLTVRRRGARPLAATRGRRRSPTSIRRSAHRGRGGSQSLPSRRSCSWRGSPEAPLRGRRGPR
jgi:hypothetical protein